jgi:hypothetical protein
MALVLTDEELSVLADFFCFQREDVRHLSDQLPSLHELRSALIGAASLRDADVPNATPISSQVSSYLLSQAAEAQKLTRQRGYEEYIIVLTSLLTLHQIPVPPYTADTCGPSSLHLAQDLAEVTSDRDEILAAYNALAPVLQAAIDREAELIAAERRASTETAALSSTILELREQLEARSKADDLHSLLEAALQHPGLTAPQHHVSTSADAHSEQELDTLVAERDALLARVDALTQTQVSLTTELCMARDEAARAATTLAAALRRAEDADTRAETAADRISELEEEIAALAPAAAVGAAAGEVDPARCVVERLPDCLSLRLSLLSSLGLPPLPAPASGTLQTHLGVRFNSLRAGTSPRAELRGEQLSLVDVDPYQTIRVHLAWKDSPLQHCPISIGYGGPLFARRIQELPAFSQSDRVVSAHCKPRRDSAGFFSWLTTSQITTGTARAHFRLCQTPSDSCVVLVGVALPQGPESIDPYPRGAYSTPGGWCLNTNNGQLFRRNARAAAVSPALFEGRPTLFVSGDVVSVQIDCTEHSSAVRFFRNCKELAGLALAGLPSGLHFCVDLSGWVTTPASVELLDEASYFQETGLAFKFDHPKPASHTAPLRVVNTGPAE